MAIYNGLRAIVSYIGYLYFKNKPVHKISKTLTQTGSFVPFTVGAGPIESEVEPFAGSSEEKIEPIKFVDLGTRFAEHQVEIASKVKQTTTEYVPQVGDPGFVMPKTEEEWKLYDEPTYLRRGCFMS